MKTPWLYLLALAVCLFTACSNGSDYENGYSSSNSSSSRYSSSSEEDIHSIPDENLDKNRNDLGLENSIVIKFADGSAEINNPYENEIKTSINEEEVIVENLSTNNTIYNLVVSGTANSGYLKIYGNKEMALYLNGVNITNPVGPAINIQGRKQTAIHLVEGKVNVLSDGANYKEETEKAKGTFYSRGTLNFFGNGHLEASGKYAHAIVADNGLKMENGNITIHNAVKNGIHINDNIYIAGGTIDIDVLGNGSKGIKADGSIAIKGGTINLKTSGDIYIDNSVSPADTSAAVGIKANGNMEISGGTITITSSGKGGKGISADGNLVISGNTTVVDVTTTGEAFGGKSSSSGNMGMRPPMNENSGKGAKAIKAKGKLIINDGNINISTSGAEAEGLESKDTLIINGGVIEVKAYDDGINASKHLAINGGKIYAESTTNDGIDSNGTMEINGGLIVSIGSTSPEEGFDCDRNTFKITGGIMIGTGGATSTPTGNVSTQNSLVYTAPAQTSTFRIEDSSGRDIFTFKFQRTYGNAKPVVLFSSPDFINGTYMLKTGGTIIGGNETWHGIYENADYSGGNNDKKII